MPSSLLTSILNGLTANPAIRDPDEVAQARIKSKIELCLCTKCICNTDLITARSSLYKYVCVSPHVSNLWLRYAPMHAAGMHCHMVVMQELFHKFLTTEQQKLQLAKSRKMKEKMEAIAAGTNAATNPGATAGTADQPSGHDEALPSPSQPSSGRGWG